MNQSGKFSLTTKRLVIGQVAVARDVAMLLRKYRQRQTTSLQRSRARKSPGIGHDSIDEVEGHALVAVEKSDELAIVGRGHVVVDRAEIPMIGNV